MRTQATSRPSDKVLCLAIAVLFLGTTLSAQRYSGHDHAVFHRPSPPPQAKHQTSSPANGPAVHPKGTTPATTPGQAAEHSASAQGKPEVGLIQPPSPAKTNPELTTTPRI